MRKKKHVRSGTNKKRHAHAIEYVLLVILVGVIALVAVTLASSGEEAVATADVPENALNVETYEVEHTGIIVRWEDPDYDVVCWTRDNGRMGGGVSCVPKSELEPSGSAK